MAIKRPPALVPLSHITGEQLASYASWSRVVDDKGRYLPWDKFQFRVNKEQDPALAWSFTRRARDAAMQFLNYANEQDERAGFNNTPLMLEVCERVDKYATAQALFQQQQRLQDIGAMLSQLRLDEAITSAQLEGANTTTQVAKNMLETGRKPRTESEQMIVGNARLMSEISSRLDEPLTPALIRHFHLVGMTGIDDKKYAPGQFRTTDDVVIADYDGNVVHQPPKAEHIDERLERVCAWVNADAETYVHPLVRACILHFMIAHEHPFRDGNGRTARALFYWFMLKSGYEAFRYISISSLLYAASTQYAYSYQYTETDGMDLTYFLEYQLGIVKRALDKFYEHIDAVLKRRARLDRTLFDSGALQRLTQRQVTLLNIMLADESQGITVAHIAERLGVSDNTARSDLKALAREGFAEARKANMQQTVYFAALR